MHRGWNNRSQQIRASSLAQRAANLGVQARAACLPDPEVACGMATWRRWWIFSFVGALGIVVQLLILTMLTAWAGVHYLVATALAVETAVLHNFIWHERWTWADRAAPDRPGWWKRLLRFQLANGTISLGGNAALMWLFAAVCAVPYTVANAAAIIICWVLNFLASDRLVFKRRGLGIWG